jgi:hypothetical protein
VERLSPWYFGILAAGAVLALAAAWQFQGAPAAVHRARRMILVTAVLAIGSGWMLRAKVSTLREIRSALSDRVLQDRQPSADDLRRAEAARQDFGRWHAGSLGVNLLTVILLTAAMALAAFLPAARAPSLAPSPASTAAHTEMPAVATPS